MSDSTRQLSIIVQDERQQQQQQQQHTQTRGISASVTAQ